MLAALILAATHGQCAKRSAGPPGAPAGAPAAAPTNAHEAVQIAPDIWEIPGAFPADQGPDGNSIIFEAPRGLIVVDTGRHRSQSEAILAFARAHAKPIVAIFNTHWHLDHSSGNRAIKAGFPEAQLYATKRHQSGAHNFLGARTPRGSSLTCAAKRQRAR